MLLSIVGRSFGVDFVDQQGAEKLAQSMSLRRPVEKLVVFYDSIQEQLSRAGILLLCSTTST
jgi:hypothetical protein